MEKSAGFMVSVRTHRYDREPEPKSCIEMQDMTTTRAKQRTQILVILGMSYNRPFTKSARSGKSSKVFNVLSTLTVLMKDILEASNMIVNQHRITTTKSSTFQPS